MRRSAATAVLAVTLSTAFGATSTMAPAVSAHAAAGSAVSGSAKPGSGSARAQAERALHTATHVLSGTAPHADASMAMLLLRLSMHALGPADRRQAAAILARPTDNPDFYGEDYTVKARQKCSGHICIHWVPTTRDAPPSTAWVDKQLRMLNQVWNYEVKKLGYRRPVSDGTRGGGGSGMFDVYLKELFRQGLYGITVAEQPSPTNTRLYSAYMLIDNDFKRSQYGGDPMQVARVTAAHEFFHAIQYGYDADDDPWMMESTATWMEDQFDDSSNDNRQYLPWSQLHEPGKPLDTGGGFEQYGNWVFFEYLSERFGRGIVKTIWRHAAAFGRIGHQFSAQAIRSSLRHHGGLTKVFGNYANGNTIPGHTYSEGQAYPAAGATSTVTLTHASPQTPWTTYRVRHLSSVDLQAKPGADLTGPGWRLRLKVDGPDRRSAPAVVVLVKRKQQPMTRTLVHLTQTGRGKVTVPFSQVNTSKVTITLADASTRYTCDTGGGYSCDGTSKDARRSFTVRLIAYKP
ncbi:MAG TPA: MXAN_6640 family putative metalloprotease [Nocardioides sp.]|uniref:MXAN_6640 family putative metalloprotease n=1 Tax=Nocardioides sp. TaxID=35761 RepID=UPI002F3FFB38